MGINNRHDEAGLDLFRVTPPAVLVDRIDSRKAALDFSDEDPLLRRLNSVHQARTLTRLLLSGVRLDDDSLIGFADDSLEDVESLGIDPTLIEGLAHNLYKSSLVKPGEKLVIIGDKRNIEILEAVARLAVEDGVDFVFDILDHELVAAIINASREGMQRVADYNVALYSHAKALIDVRSNPDPSISFDTEKRATFVEMNSRFSRRLKDGDMHYTLTIIPTEEDARLDGMDYEEYMNLFLEACDMPNDEIDVAHRILINRLNTGKHLSFDSDDGTHLHMSIEGMTFANSIALKNIPGSEVFSAPVLNSVSGKLVAKGNFEYDGVYFEDIELWFEDGEVTECDAKVNGDKLKEFIFRDSGTKRVGEIGIGTNPHLRRHLVNALLVEKIGGSFHLAMGNCYKYKMYRGSPVNLDNGNNCDGGSFHWDITSMLRGKNGKMYLDGQLIQDNGLWVDEDGYPDESLAVLNYGWGALPEDKQPDWWKERYPNGYVD